MENETMEKALREAVEMEEKGYNFYKQAVQKVKNDVSKKTFQFLANCEVFHIESIKKFYVAMGTKEDFPVVDLEKFKDERMKDLNIFSTSIKELDGKITPDDDDKKAYEFAMDFENKGYKYYENMLKEAKDERLIELLKFLLSEERKHYEIIESSYTYLTDSKNWFMYEEGSFPQG